MSLSPTAQRWATLVAKLESSNVTAVEFAAAHNVNYSTLSWWRSRFRGSITSRAFVEVEVTPVSRAACPPLCVELVARNVVVEVPQGTDLRWLRAVVEALS